MSTMEPKKRPAAKGSKGTKTNKTSHVLNLLGGAAPPAEEPATAAPMPTPAVQSPQQETAAQEAPQQTSAPQAPAPVILSAPSTTPSLPILAVARNNNERLSDTICAALEQALVEEEAVQQMENPPGAQGSVPEQTDIPPEPTPQTKDPALSQGMPSVASAPAPEEESASAEPESSPAAEEAPTKQEPSPAVEEAPAKQEPSPAVEEVPAKPEPPPSADAEDPLLVLPDNALFLNVMDLLVDETLQQYAKPSGLCQCPRCMADAKALALSRLPAKYTVIPKPAIAPMLSLYREEFRSDVLAQVLQACNIVKEKPRHLDPLV